MSTSQIVVYSIVAYLSGYLGYSIVRSFVQELRYQRDRRAWEKVCAEYERYEEL